MDFLLSIISPGFLLFAMTEEGVAFIVMGIVVLQILFFMKNVRRMAEYKNIFVDQRRWSIVTNSQGFVTGIDGNGNKVFEAIKDSINKYLGNNSGSVIDFSLLKDAVDRHCDAVENDINTLTPIPLYCGLAGTMAGVIIGLFSLLATESISDLLTSGSGNFGVAADGVNALLSGVAWAMLASICGIMLTTISSLLFKRYRLQGELGKNAFLSWLQAELLPELPSDTSDALNRLVQNLNKFNDTFAKNTSELRCALGEVNESYRIQGEIIKAVHDMDVMKMAQANVRVLQELQACTDKLEAFNLYLDGIHGYTDAIHKFTSLFEQESNRLHVLEEIQQFFTRHKAEIKKDAANVDRTLSDALRDLKEKASSNTAELHSVLVRQVEEFKKVIQEERAAFESVSREICEQFRTQLTQIPMLAQQLADIAEIPAKLDALAGKIEKSNRELASQVGSTMARTADTLLSERADGNTDADTGVPAKRLGLRGWKKCTAITAAVIVVAGSIANMVFWFCFLFEFLFGGNN